MPSLNPTITYHLHPTLTFNPIPLLPKELRHLVWELASKVPRLVIIRRKWLGFGDEEPDESFFCLEAIPSVLHTCQESRSIAQAFYKRAFTIGLNPRYLYINFKFDTIHVSDSYLSKLQPSERAQIRSLILEVTDTESLHYFTIPEDMDKMKALEELEILSPISLRHFASTIRHLRQDFAEWFGGEEGWVCPKMRIVDQETGEKSNERNFEQKFWELRRRWRGGGRGIAGPRGTIIRSVEGVGMKNLGRI